MEKPALLENLVSEARRSVSQVCALLSDPTPENFSLCEPHWKRAIGRVESVQQQLNLSKPDTVGRLNLRAQLRSLQKELGIASSLMRNAGETFGAWQALITPDEELSTGSYSPTGPLPMARKPLLVVNG